MEIEKRRTLVFEFDRRRKLIGESLKDNELPSGKYGR